MLVDNKEAFYGELEEHFDSRPINKLSSSLQARYWKRLQQVGLAHKKMSAFQYFPLAQFYTIPFVPAQTALVSIEEVDKHTLPECEGAVIVLINGELNQELSRLEALEGACSVLRFEDAMRSYGSFIEMRSQQEIKFEKDPFTLVNGAFYSEAAFLHVPAKMQISQPIQVLQFVTSCAETSFIFPRLHVFLGSEAQAHIAMTKVISREGGYVYNGVVEATLESGAHLKIEQEVIEAPKSWFFASLRAQLKGDGYLEAIRITDGGKGVHFDDYVQLIGEQAKCELNALAILEQAYAQANVLMEHKAPHCTSSQLFKNVLKGSSESNLNKGSKSSFEGKIYVHSEAQKTDAFQLNNNLILDDFSTASAKPNLEIFADDVKASHGATTAEIDREALFYLRSRGISYNKAKELLIQAFCMEVIQKIETNSLRENALKLLRNYGK